MGQREGLVQWLLVVMVVAVVCVAGVEGRTLLSAKDHRYKMHDSVPLFANKVGPFHNPRCASYRCLTRVLGHLYWGLVLGSWVVAFSFWMKGLGSEDSAMTRYHENTLWSCLCLSL